jgi:hypothetical protein
MARHVSAPHGEFGWATSVVGAIPCTYTVIVTEVQAHAGCVGGELRHTRCIPGDGGGAVGRFVPRWVGYAATVHRDQGVGVVKDIRGLCAVFAAVRHGGTEAVFPQVTPDASEGATQGNIHWR